MKTLVDNRNTTSERNSPILCESVPVSYLPDREDIHLCKYFSGSTATEYITYDSFMQLEHTLVICTSYGRRKV